MTAVKVVSMWKQNEELKTEVVEIKKFEPKKAFLEPKPAYGMDGRPPFILGPHGYGDVYGGLSVGDYNSSYRAEGYGSREGYYGGYGGVDYGSANGSYGGPSLGDYQGKNFDGYGSLFGSYGGIFGGYRSGILGGYGDGEGFHNYGGSSYGGGYDAGISSGYGGSYAYGNGWGGYSGKNTRYHPYSR